MTSRLDAERADFERELAAIFAELTPRLQAGEGLNVDEILQRHPQHADVLRDLLPTMKMLAELGGKRTTQNGFRPTERDEELPTRLGDYSIVRELGRGGMGVVYEADQISLQRRVALKVLPFAAMLNPTQLQRFKNEALAASALDHPHIVRILDVGFEEGVHFFAMQLIQGQNLAEMISRQAVDGESASGPADCGPEYVQKVTQYVIQAANALDHAHEMGIVHRDIKPSNLMEDAEGHVYVTDFGLAQVKNETGLTMSGDTLGTLRYMSPEQATGDTRALDRRTDVYSLGATLYELLTFRPAVVGDDRSELLRAIAQRDPTCPSELNASISNDLDKVVRRAIAKSPQDRYGTAAEFAADLRRVLDHETIQGKPRASRYRTKRWLQRHWIPVTCAAVLLAAAVCGLGTYNALNSRGVNTMKLSISERILRGNGGSRGGERRRRLLVEPLEDRRLLAGDAWYELTELTSLSVFDPTDEVFTADTFGDTIAVGARRADTPTAVDAGVVHVFSRNDGGTPMDPGDDTWPLTQSLQPTDLGDGDLFGFPIEIKDDLMVIGATHQTTTSGGSELGDGLGVAYVYRQQGGSWSLEQRLEPIPRSFDENFSWGAIDIQDNTIVIGAKDDDNANGLDAGAAHVYRYDGIAWQHTAKLIAPDGSGYRAFGIDVIVDGSEIFVYGPRDSDSDPASGMVYVFRETATDVWEPAAALTASDASTGDAFGFRLAKVGDRLVAGAPHASVGGEANGAVYVFAKDANGNWVEEQKLTPSISTGNDRFGYGVDYNGDSIVVGALDTDNPWMSVPDSGLVFTFHQINGEWTETSVLVSTDSNGGNFGGQIYLGSHTMVIMDGSHSHNGPISGGAYVFADDATRTRQAYSSQETPVALKDARPNSDAVTTSQINIAAAGNVLDVDVLVDISHTRVSDLDLSLIAPDGLTEIPLFSSEGGDGSDFPHTIFDDQADRSIEGQTAPFWGSFRPLGSLSDLNGIDVAGTWTLKITDNVRRETGVLNNWSLIVKHSVPAPVPGIMVNPTSGLTTTESGGSDSFTVVLDTPPSDNVVIDVTSLDPTEGAVVTTSPLTFTPSNWSTPQTVTVAGVDDTDSDGDIQYWIELAAPVTNDPNYSTIDPNDVSVINVDDEQAASVTVYVNSIFFQDRAGKDWQAVVEVFTEDGTAAVGATVQIEFAGQLYTGQTDENGLFQTGYVKKLGSGTYVAEAMILDLDDGFEWNQNLDVPNDADGDGLPEAELVI